jgi:hypothetical protein
MEVQRADLRESVLVLAAGVVGVPAAAIGVQSVTEAIAARRTGTDGSSSQPQQEAPSPPSGSQS